MGATIKDVAKLAGVSVSTASIALRGKGPVHPSTRDRVLAAARKLDYRPNVLAQDLVQKRRRTVGIMVPDIRDPYFHELVRGVEGVAWDSGLTLMLGDTNRSPSKERALIETFRSHRVGGLIMAGGGYESNPFDPGDPEMPVVVIGRHRTPHASVRVDNIAAGRIVTDHLLQQGSRRPAFIGGPEDLTTSLDRALGYTRALQAAGLAVDYDYIVHADFTPEGGRQAIAALFAQLKSVGKAPPDSVFAANDQMALGALKGLKAMGLQVPADVTVAGVGDIPMATYVDPPLTTAALPLRRMGEEAMRLLLRLNAGESAPQEPLVLPVRLVVRESTARPTPQRAQATTRRNRTQNV